MAMGKRERESVSDAVNKRRRGVMDGVVRVFCWRILEKVMSHPDVREILEKRRGMMDLETVKRRLEADVYSDAEKFAADVRLAFENAIQCSPSLDKVHAVAKYLRLLFDKLWDGMNARLKNIPTNGLDYKKSLLLRRDGNGLPESRGEEAAQIRCSSMENNTEGDLQPSISSKQQCHSTDSELNLKTEAIHSGGSDSKSDGCTPKLSPKHAERAAMLKERFAGIIRKATHSDLPIKSLDPSLKQKGWPQNTYTSPSLEDEVSVKKVSKAATLEEKRAATRMELEKMENHALFDDNSSAEREMLILCGGGFEEFFETNPLEKCGLFMKHGDDDDDDFYLSSALDGEELEEGEIQP